MDDAPETATRTTTLFESLVENMGPGNKDQEHRESKNRWLDFALGGARAIDRARILPPKNETGLMDAVEDEMEASKAPKSGPPETVPTRHLLD